jgi:hypothetical protein
MVSAGYLCNTNNTSVLQVVYDAYSCPVENTANKWNALHIWPEPQSGSGQTVNLILIHINNLSNYIVKDKGFSTNENTYRHGNGKKSKYSINNKEVIKILVECKRRNSTCSDSKRSKSNCSGFTKKLLPFI